MRKKRPRSVKNNKDLSFLKPAPAPPSTKKHDALVEMRRKAQNEKLESKVRSQSENYVRNIK